MMNFFGKKKKEVNTTVSSTSASKPSDAQTTIVKLRESIANQDKREEHIQNKINSVIAEAKTKMAKGDKKGALYAMKRKKLYEQEQAKIQNVRFTLETQVINLESAQQNAQTYSALKQGNTAMQGIRKEVGIEQVDDVMDEIKEEMDMAQEINDAIAQPVDPLMADEDELLEELNMLETADLEAELLKPPPTAAMAMPAAPDSKLPALAQKEEDDLKALEAELAGL
jgi:charged multivesicular body protein 4